LQKNEKLSYDADINFSSKTHDVDFLNKKNEIPKTQLYFCSTMKINLLVVSKTNSSYLIAGENEYLKRLSKWCTVEYTVLNPPKNAAKLHIHELKNEEGKSFLNKIQSTDYVILLDENGQHMSSEDFAMFLEKTFLRSPKRLVFVVGGAYGFSDEVYQRADAKISLSKMTFSHQMVRMIFLEQLYRAYSIMNHEPYHHS